MGSGAKYLEFRVRYRSILVVLAVAVVVALVAALVNAWATATRQAVVAGSQTNIGSGVWLHKCWPRYEVDVVYPSSEDVVAVQTVRNDARWEVEVVSQDPEAFRFGTLTEHHRDEVSLPAVEGGAPDDEATSDRVVIPPGHEAVMWIVDPFQGVPTSGSHHGIVTVPVRVGSLGVSHETEIELSYPIWVSGGDFDGDRLEAKFDEACAELNG